MTQADNKRRAAIAAADEVRDGMLVGLGTGSTAAFLIEELGRRVAAGLRIEATATSRASEALAAEHGIAVHPFEAIARLDLAIDGADELDPYLRAIKGAGGAMLREKVVASAADRMVAIVDGSKWVDRLGAAPLPVEVLPFAAAFVADRLRQLDLVPTRRQAGADAYRTDQNNLVLDCRLARLDDPAALATALAAIPGVLGHGLFVTEVDAAYVARDDRVDRIERQIG